MLNMNHCIARSVHRCTRYPREEWIDQGKPPPKTPAERSVDPSKNNAPDLDQTGDYVNMEVAFAYAAQPGQSEQLRSKNIHLLIEFFLGVRCFMSFVLLCRIQPLSADQSFCIFFLLICPILRSTTGFTFQSPFGFRSSPLLEPSVFVFSSSRSTPMSGT